MERFSRKPHPAWLTALVMAFFMLVFLAQGVWGWTNDSGRLVWTRASGDFLIVTSRTDSGPGSLRQALLDARPGDVIRFDPTIFPPDNPQTIYVLDALPPLTQGHITIDASDAGVILDGRYTPPYTDGFVIRSSHNVIKGLQIIHFTDDGIDINGDLGEASYNQIGGDWRVGAAPRGEGNIITGNGATGVDINSSNAFSNTVMGNLIGLDANGTEDIRIQALVLSPSYTSDQTIFVGTRYHGVMKSTDGGRSWEMVGQGLESPSVISFAISPNFLSDGILFAGTADNALYRSSDKGEHWERVGSDVFKRNPVAIALSPNFVQDQQVFAVTDGDAFFFSHDGGETWTGSREGIAEWVLHDIAVSPNYAHDHTIFISSWKQIFKSEDGGVTWKTIAAGLTDGITKLAISPEFERDHTLFFVRRACNVNDILWRSTDGGVSWQALHQDVSLCTPRTIALAPDFPSEQTIYLGDDWNGIYKSVDGGLSWGKMYDEDYIWALALSPNYGQDGIVFAGTKMGQLFASKDGGLTWQNQFSAFSEQGNREIGVLIRNGASWNVVGGEDEGARNVIGRNHLEGVLIMEENSDHNHIQGNYVGVSLDGSSPAGNGSDGVSVKMGAKFNLVGGPDAGNTISGNGGQGLLIADGETIANRVEGNLIGLDAEGLHPIGNLGSGLLIAGYNAADSLYENIIGGDTPSKRNIISGNGENGISIWGNTHRNVVIGNWIGTDITGSRALGNHFQGVVLGLGTNHNRIGGAEPGERNVISGNEGTGVAIWENGTAYNHVLGNYIGVDVSGLKDLGNGGHGVIISGAAEHNTIGGSALGEGNVIAGNAEAQVNVAGAETSDNEIIGNNLGVASDGVTPMGGRWGVACWTGSQKTTIAENVIAGNSSGIHLADSHYNHVHDNFIGVDRTGAIEIGNWENGVTVIEGSNHNKIGPNNIIAFNHFMGVGIWDPATQFNTITQNAIYGNYADGIRVDNGANGALSHPAISKVTPTSVEGIAPVAGARIEIFSDEGEQGRVFEGVTVADDSGAFSFTKHEGFNDARLTATATDSHGNSSEFSIPAERPTPAGADPYEPDDHCTRGRHIPTDGLQQWHTFHQASDVDWLQFDVIAGKRYIIQVDVPVESSADAELEVYDYCSGSPLDSQENAFNPGIRLMIEAPETGPIFLKIAPSQSSGSGENARYLVSVRQVSDDPRLGAVVIVAGRLKYNDSLQANIHAVSNEAYRLFVGQGYSPDRIQYLATDLSLDADGDGRSDVDALSTEANLERALTTWTVDKVGADRALTLFMVDHGSRGIFYLDKPNLASITPQQLDVWLTQVEQRHPGIKINVIYEACLSGSFITLPSPLSRRGRLIITSTGSANPAWASDRGAAFSDYFLEALRQGNSLYGSFQQASWAVQNAGFEQTPWLDSNGNGIPNEDEDAVEASRRGFAFNGTLVGDLDEWSPHIEEVSAPQVQRHQWGTLRSKVSDDLDVRFVWAVIYPPDYTPPPTTEEWVQETWPTILLQDKGDGWYEGVYKFDELGDYRVVFYAEDNQQLRAIPVYAKVTVGASLYLPLLSLHPVQ